MGWKDLTGDELGWRRSERSFVEFTLGAWGMRKDCELFVGLQSAGPPPGPGLGLPPRGLASRLELFRSAGPGLLPLPGAGALAEVVWELRGDCKAVVEALNGRWVLEAEGAPLASRLCEKTVSLLLALWSSGAAAGREDEEGWLAWVPRRLNAAADLLSQVVLDTGEACSELRERPPGPGVLRAWFDGALRERGQGGAAAVLFWYPDGGEPTLLGWEAAPVLADFALEVEAVAAGLLLRAVRGLVGAAPGVPPRAWAAALVAALEAWPGHGRVG